MSRNGGPNTGSLGAPRGALTSYDSTQERYIPFFQGTAGEQKFKSRKGVGVGRPDNQPNKRARHKRARPKQVDVSPKMPEANVNQSKVMNK